MRAVGDEAGLFDEVMSTNRELSGEQRYVIAVLASCCIAEIQKTDGADTRWQDVMGRALERRSKSRDTLPAPGSPGEDAELGYSASHFQPTGRKPDCSAAGILQMCFEGKFSIRIPSRSGTQ